MLRIGPLHRPRSELSRAGFFVKRSTCSPGQSSGNSVISKAHQLIDQIQGRAAMIRRNPKRGTLRAAALTATAALTVCSTSSSAVAQDAYLCAADAATGMSYSEATKQWQPTTFNSADTKYLFRKARDGEKFAAIEYKWALFPLGSLVPITWCKGDFTETGTIFCPAVVALYLNRNNLRYQLVHQIGYVAPEGREGSATPYIEIGRCSPV